MIVKTKLNNGEIALEIITEKQTKKRNQTTTILSFQAERIAKLRRRMQKFSASYRLTELSDEIYQIIRLEAAQKRGKWIYEEDKKRIERKPKIRKFPKKFEEFGEKSARSKMKFCLKFMANSADEDRKLSDEICYEKEKRFQEYLFELLKVSIRKSESRSNSHFSAKTPIGIVSVFLRQFAVCFKKAKQS